MNQKTENIFRWIAVLPSAYIGAYLISALVVRATNGIYNFFDYIIWYLKMSIIADMYIDFFLPYFVAALVFVLIGAYIAPTHKKIKMAILFSFFYYLIFVILGILSLYMELFAGLPGLGTLIGESLGIFIIWIYKARPWN